MIFGSRNETSSSVARGALCASVSTTSTHGEVSEIWLLLYMSDLPASSIAHLIEASLLVRYAIL